MASSIGRPIGTPQVDQNGLTKYQFKITVPAGIGYGNEPDLSLDYCQGAANGIVGKGWSLGGLSSIRLIQPSMPFEGVNCLKEYDRRKPKFSLDNAELLNVDGPYGSPGTLYVTESAESERNITHLGTGFLVRDSGGMKFEYGTTPDSCVVSQDGLIKEWRIKKQFDPHGNFVTYNYSQSPVRFNSSTQGQLDKNASYPESILYTSNEVTGYVGKRLVLFEYASRNDTIVQTIWGDQAIYASILSAVHIAVGSVSNPKIVRSYQLKYEISRTSNVSCLMEIEEKSAHGSPMSLTPTKFSYTSSGVLPDGMFSLDQEGITSLSQVENVVSVLPMNISGRCLTDLACICYDPNTGESSVRTYLANRTFFKDTETLSSRWSLSEGNGSNATLPLLPMDGTTTVPSFLTADISGDGRYDIIVPYTTPGGFLNFSLSLSTGTGFEDYRIKETDYGWSDEAIFMTADLEGSGHTDVIEIFPYHDHIAFRIFRAVEEDGAISLGSAIEVETDHDFYGTITWLEVQTQRSLQRSLVRVYQVDVELGRVELRATTFALEDPNNRGINAQDMTSSLGTYDKGNMENISILPCDINGDGVQDLVTCYVHWERAGANYKLQFVSLVFLSDGLGSFKQHGQQIIQELEVNVDEVESEPGRFYVASLNGSDYPNLIYVYRELVSKDIVAVSVQGSSDGTLKNISLNKIVVRDSIPTGDYNLAPVDLGGTWTADWLLTSPMDGAYTVCPVVNKNTVCDFLETARDSMGLLTTFKYAHLTDSRVYSLDAKPANAAARTLTSNQPILAAPNFVVSGIVSRNDPTVNSIPYHNEVIKRYSGAVVNIRGRGWQGFANVMTYNVPTDSTTIEYFSQEWPSTGTQIRLDTAAGRFEDCDVLQSENWKYKPQWTKRGPWSTFRPLLEEHRIDALDNNILQRSCGNTYTHDSAGNLLVDCSWNSAGSKLYTTYEYMSLSDLVSLPIRKKVSSKETNKDLSRFEDGDFFLMHTVFDSTTGILKSMSDWSSDVGAFATTTYTFDQYGNQIENVDELGLRTRIDFDEVYHTYPLATSETAPGVAIRSYKIYDELTGLEVSNLDENGAMTCLLPDVFGRTSLSCKNVAVPGAGKCQTAAEFFSNLQLIGADKIPGGLDNIRVTPDRSQVCEQVVSAKGAVHMCTRSKVFYDSHALAQGETTEYIDCMGRTRKLHVTQGDLLDVWAYSDFDSRGCKTQQSFPVKALDLPPSADPLDWAPATETCMVMAYDCLQRLTSETRPTNSGKSHFVVSRYSHQKGGARVDSERFSIDKASGGAEQRLSRNTKIFENIAEEEHLIARIEDDGSETCYGYDQLGRLTKVEDPSGNVESRTYNSLGAISKTNNSSQGEILRSYDVGGNLTRDTNAMGQVTTFSSDARGRLLLKTGYDGRKCAWTYYEGNNLLESTVTTGAGGGDEESRTSLAYDQRGQLKSRSVKIDGSETFTTSLSYDWQGRIKEKCLPDGSILTWQSRGALAASTSMKINSWSLSCNFDSYSAAASPEKWKLQGQGVLDTTIENMITYDSHGFPLSHTMSTGPQTVMENYLYDDLDQLTRVHEFHTGETSDYGYINGQLSHYQAEGNAVSYEYDKSGNMIKKGDLSFTRDFSSLKGSRQGQEILKVEYDGCGRMTKRTWNTNVVSLEYDSFHNVCKMEDHSNQNMAHLTHDHDGHLLVTTLEDGSRDVHVDVDFNVLIRKDGSRQIRRKFYSADRLIAIVRTETLPSSTTEIKDSRTSVNTYYSNTKGNISHVFGSNGQLLEKIRYDPFGLTSDPGGIEEVDATYESQPLNKLAGLYNFKARWYDPLVCRFSSPDDIVDEASLKGRNGTNRYAFECNDPVNQVDPTGHWSAKSVWGAIIGIGLIAVGVAVTALTGGAGTPLAMLMVWGAVSGALIGAGANALTYSIQHRDEQDATKFWKGWAATTAVGAVAGAVTGAFAAGLASANGVSKLVAGADRAITGIMPSGLAMKIVSKAMFYGGRALLGGFSSMVNKIVSNATEKHVFGRKDVNLMDGVGIAFMTGAASAIASTAASRWWSGGGNVKVYEKLGMKSKAAAAAAENSAKAAQRAAMRTATPSDLKIELIGGKYQHVEQHWNEFFGITGKGSSIVAGGPPWTSINRTNPFK